jgi:cytochrome c1
MDFDRNKRAGGLPRPPMRWVVTGLFFLCIMSTTACNQDKAAQHADYGADTHRGFLTIQRAGCGSCHLIPGVPNSDGLVGPPLDHFANRRIVAGLLPNTPDHLVRWLRFPQSVVPGNVMPDTGLSEEQARDVAAYLYTLE